MRDPGSILYSVAIESAATLDTSPERSEFAERALREATRRGFTAASRCVVLGDGSAWIWNTAAEPFPQAIQILDRFHAKEHLSQVDRRRRGRLQGSDRYQAQTGWHALDRKRRKLHHRPALLETQWTL